tara:strand:+ start:870 stop:1862 length:993 start_codon:yes stop_codon:yes gene_type:complete
MRVLVTGGCGFIGQHLVLEMAGRHDVSVLDACLRVATGEPRLEAEGIDIYKGHVQDHVLVRQVLHEVSPDVVIHCAAQSHVDQSLVDPGFTWQSNAIGTQVVARMCAAMDIPLLYCSTDEVYGSTPKTSSGSPIPVREKDGLLNPSSPYSASKLAGELAVRSCGHSYGLRYMITRGSNAFGPHQYSEKLVPIICLKLLSGQPVPLHGTGNQMRQWVHVSEFARCLSYCAEKLVRGEGHTTYNIAGPSHASVKDIILRFAEVAGVPHGRAYIHTADRPGQDENYLCSGDSLAELMLDWRPSIDIFDEEVIIDLLQHYGESGQVPMIAEFCA